MKEKNKKRVGGIIVFMGFLILLGAVGGEDPYESSLTVVLGLGLVGVVLMYIGAKIADFVF